MLLLVMLSVTFTGVHESAQAKKRQVQSACSTLDLPASADSPCAPCEHHNDHDCCDSCVNCSCHASLTVQPFQLSYDPLMSELSISDPFKHLPEVYLTRFIPPQIHA